MEAGPKVPLDSWIDVNAVSQRRANAAGGLVLPQVIANRSQRKKMTVEPKLDERWWRPQFPAEVGLRRATHAKRVTMHMLDKPSLDSLGMRTTRSWKIIEPNLDKTEKASMTETIADRVGAVGFGSRVYLVNAHDLSVHDGLDLIKDVTLEIVRQISEPESAAES